MKDRFKASDVVVVIFHDHGTRYLGKMYNEDWMRDRGFIAPKPLTTALDLIAGHAQLPLLSVKTSDTCEHVIALMQKYSVSQLPVKDEANNFIGAIEDASLYAELLKNRDLMSKPVAEIMVAPYPVVSHMASIEEVSSKINKANAAVLMMDMGGNWHIITKQDLIQAISKGN
jgi:cystathionine beta-synthase